jgi:Zn-dependent protease
MRDLFLWSIPLGRLFGVTVRVHWLFPFVALGMVLHVALYRPPQEAPLLEMPPGAWIDTLIAVGLLFVVVLLHEFGHVFGARWVDGDAQEVLMWPLGGLAFTEVPHTPRANVIATAAGPAVNLLICVACAGLLLVVYPQALQPPWNPLPDRGFPWRDSERLVTLYTWAGTAVRLSPYSLPVFLARAFWLSYFLFLLNVLLVGFPLDGGRMLQAVLWRYVGYRQATFFAVVAGFVIVLVVSMYAIIMKEVLAFGLALFIASACYHQWVVLETGGDDVLFGAYDFSQGYTSLEREQPPAPPRRKASWWQRWQQRRLARKVQREQETREAEERRLDALLEKVQREGISALTDEERRFMKRVSDRYRNRN